MAPCSYVIFVVVYPLSCATKNPNCSFLCGIPYSTCLRRNLATVRCERSDGETTSSLDITDKIALLQRRLKAAEDLLEATARGLQETAIEVRTGVV